MDSKLKQRAEILISALYKKDQDLDAKVVRNLIEEIELLENEIVNAHRNDQRDNEKLMGYAIMGNQ